MGGKSDRPRLPTACAWLLMVAIIAVVMPLGTAAARGREAPSDTTPPDAASAVVAAARSHIGAPYGAGGTGPRFDCSGLVYRVFKETGQIKAIGGKRRSAAGYLDWFDARGLVSRRDGQPGDLAVFGGGSHIGIYIGSRKVISALIGGVRKHRINRMTIPFTAFLHTHLSGGPTPTPSPTPRPSLTARPSPTPRPST